MNRFFDLRRSHTFLQDVGFYFLFLIFTILCAILLSSIVKTSNSHGSFETGLLIGQICAIILCVSFSFFIIILKNLWTNFLTWILLILGAAGAYTLGALLGSIFVTVLYCMHGKRNRCHMNELASSQSLSANARYRSR